MGQIINGIKPVFCGKKDCILEARYERTFFLLPSRESMVP
jgi:hypothetical protein